MQIMSGFNTKTLILALATLAVCNAGDSTAQASASIDKTSKTSNSILNTSAQKAQIYFAAPPSTYQQQAVTYQQQQPTTYQQQQPPITYQQHQQQQPSTYHQAAAAAHTYQQPQHYQTHSQLPAQHYVQIIARQQHPQQQQFYLPQHAQPAAIMIIAQPALVPHHLLYGGGGGAGASTQQLLNYFHGNPQARYQLLHGGGNVAAASYQPHPSAQPYVVQSSSAAQAVPNYQYLTQASSGASAVVPQQQQNYASYVQAPSHLFAQYPQYSGQQQYSASSGSHPPQQQTYNLNQIGQLASQQATHYSSGQPIKSAPPIITGFENFTPEQQAQIKQQLSAQLGQLTPLSVGGSSNNLIQQQVHQQYAKYSQPISAGGHSSSSGSASAAAGAESEEKSSGSSGDSQSSNSNFTPMTGYRSARG